MAEAVKELIRVGSANVSDALRSLGKHFQAMDGGIRPIASGMAVAGPAFTVRCYPGATFALEKALELAKPGDVLVVDGGGYPDVILMGGLMSTRCQQRGIAGAILDAAVRDIDDIIVLNFPVFSRYICPRAGTFAEIGECQTTICCGRLPVTPGDWVLADASGIVVIPGDLLDATVEKATAINQREGRIAHHLREGRTLSESAAAAANGQK
jgi:regulator of RNase E activity RraA